MPAGGEFMKPDCLKMSAWMLGRGWRPLFAASLIAVACGSTAEAKCQDAPGPETDWSGCSKARIMLTVSVQMAIGFAFMRHVPVGRAALVCVWIGLVAYFALIVKTAEED